MLKPKTKPLTKTQLDYLEAINDQEWLTRGWGGYSSTLTVRILEERGLITLREEGREGWEAHIRPGGREALLAAGRYEHLHYSTTDERIAPLKHGHAGGNLNHPHEDQGYRCAAWV